MEEDFNYFLNDFSSRLTGSEYVHYLLVVVLFATIIRFILSLFKGLAHHRKETGLSRTFGLKKYILRSFLSNARDLAIDDYWIPFAIGLFELYIFPFLFAYNLSKIAAGWIGIKAIGSWNTRNPRTAYNRFLLGNLLSISASYWLWRLFLK
jgi:hypothetical protein